MNVQDATPFAARDRAHGNTTILEVVGTTNLERVDMLRRRFDDLIDGGVRDLVIDVSGVAYVAMTFLGLIIETGRRIQQADGNMSVVTVEERAHRLLTRLDSPIPVYETCERALSERRPA